MTKAAKFSSITFAAFALSIGCGSTTAPATVELPKSLNIAAITVAGSSDSWTPVNPVTLSHSCVTGAPLLVSIAPQPLLDTATNTSTIDNFTLAVPGNCGTNISCGWLRLHVTPTVGEELDLSSATSPITVNGLSQAGSATFILELHDSYDFPFKGSDGNPFGDEATVDFTEPSGCPAPNTGDAGT